jgi:hypothetical protein
MVMAVEALERTAKTADCCADCGRALGPMDSVTMVVLKGRVIEHPEYVHPLGRLIKAWTETRFHRVPICILRSLVTYHHRWRWRGPTCALEEHRIDAPVRRFRCEGCDRPMRVMTLWGRMRWVETRTCCTDCERTVRYRRNNQRRRIKPQTMTCSECGEAFEARAGALTCSNRCRQAAHRKRTMQIENSPRI